ncbi:MAG TPA: PEP-CTERM sorting domain-containing protein [Pyrinomonadaceae bacterium]|nr:PEP-CTERM sorting domain-containing protein [Pyrinomonadaceae bacterium]
MRRNSLRPVVRILLLGLLLGTSSSAYADVISITSVSLSNYQFIPTAGTIVFSLPRTQALARATNSLNQDVINITESMTTSQATANVTFASASAVSDAVNASASQNSNVMLLGCDCSAFSVGQTILQGSFMIIGGTGNVDVNVSGLLLTTQTVMTDQFGLLAESDVLVGLHLGSSSIFPTIFSTVTIGPNSSVTLEMERQLSQVLTLQFNTLYRFDVTLSANSSGQNQAPGEIPEPATVVLLVSGLGFMSGFLKKRRSRTGV